MHRCCSACLSGVYPPSSPSDFGFVKLLVSGRTGNMIITRRDNQADTTSTVAIPIRRGSEQPPPPPRNNALEIRNILNPWKIHSLTHNRNAQAINNYDDTHEHIPAFHKRVHMKTLAHNYEHLRHHDFFQGNTQDSKYQGVSVSMP